MAGNPKVSRALARSLTKLNYAPPRAGDLPRSAGCPPLASEPRPPGVPPPRPWTPPATPEAPLCTGTCKPLPTRDVIQHPWGKGVREGLTAEVHLNPGGRRVGGFLEESASGLLWWAWSTGAEGEQSGPPACALSLGQRVLLSGPRCWPVTSAGGPAGPCTPSAPWRSWAPGAQEGASGPRSQSNLH